MLVKSFKSDQPQHSHPPRCPPEGGGAALRRHRAWGLGGRLWHACRAAYEGKVGQPTKEKQGSPRRKIGPKIGPYIGPFKGAHIGPYRALTIGPFSYFVFCIPYSYSLFGFFHICFFVNPSLLCQSVASCQSVCCLTSQTLRISKDDKAAHKGKIRQPLVGP